MSAVPRYPAGLELIHAGDCPIGATEEVACWYCRYGHAIECHHPLSCEEAACEHSRRLADSLLTEFERIPPLFAEQGIEELLQSFGSRPYVPGNKEAATMLCRVCGCSTFNPCPGGCYWVEPHLCSRCQEETRIVLP